MAYNQYLHSYTYAKSLLSTCNLTLFREGDIDVCVVVLSKNQISI